MQTKIDKDEEKMLSKLMSPYNKSGFFNSVVLNGILYSYGAPQYSLITKN